MNTTPLTDILNAWRATHEAESRAEADVEQHPTSTEALIRRMHVACEAHRTRRDSYLALLEVARSLVAWRDELVALVKYDCISDHEEAASQVAALDRLLAPLTKAEERGA